MSTRSETVLAALADGITNRAELAEATGLEVQAVSQELSILRSKGLADKTPDGWAVTGGTPGRKEHLQATPKEPQKTQRKAAKKVNGGGASGCRGQGIARVAGGRGVRRVRRDAPGRCRAAARAAPGAAACRLLMER